MAQPIARRLGVLLEVAAPGERADQALHDGRAEIGAPRQLAHPELGALGLDHFQDVEPALERLRSRRPLGVAASRPRRGDQAARRHAARPEYRYIVSIVARSQDSGLGVN